MTNVLLLRHGNTFDPPMAAYWVGAGSNLPMSKSGEFQAINIGDYLSRKQDVHYVCYHGQDLKQTQFAHVLVSRLGERGSCVQDVRLSDVHLGSWEGRRTHEIVDQYNEAEGEVQAWAAYGCWPSRAGWMSSEVEVINRLRDVIAHTANHTNAVPLLICTSAILTATYRLCNTQRQAKIQPWTRVGTGRLVVLNVDSAQNISLVSWNIAVTDIT